MVQGSSSSAGKSLLATALCRIYARRGLRVAPFKAQNMSNNAAACAGGGEIGRAQALQAQAAGLKPAVEMNPILIKPESDARSQIIVNGRPWQTLPAWNYYENKAYLWSQVVRALDSLREAYDLIIIEGAGSPAELNLAKGDIVNMAVARYAQATVLLVGDIDRGGIFAQLLGTLWLLEPEERALVRGLVVNKFRGDPDLFATGVGILEEKGGVAVLGVVPYISNLYLPEEDAVALDEPGGGQESGKVEIDIAVIRLPHISNFDDFDPLRMEPGVGVRYVHTSEELGRPDAIILPGSKSTITDLAWLRACGLADAIKSHAANGGAVAGLCGGYQMLGERISDPLLQESRQVEVDGLGLLPATTTFAAQKTTRKSTAVFTNDTAWLAELKGCAISGYEIHNGRTYSKEPWLKIVKRDSYTAEAKDGSMSPDGRVWGCYLHGIFEDDWFRPAWLHSLGWSQEGVEHLIAKEKLHSEIDRLADTVEAALKMDELDRMIGL
jgi:adenosylcobyric acid synthase